MAAQTVSANLNRIDYRLTWINILHQPLTFPFSQLSEFFLIYILPFLNQETSFRIDHLRKIILEIGSETSVALKRFLPLSIDSRRVGISSDDGQRSLVVDVDGTG
jgi:hypothetical protein